MILILEFEIEKTPDMPAAKLNKLKPMDISDLLFILS